MSLVKKISTLNQDSVFNIVFLFEIALLKTGKDTRLLTNFTTIQQ